MVEAAITEEEDLAGITAATGDITAAMADIGVRRLERAAVGSPALLAAFQAQEDRPPEASDGPATARPPMLGWRTGSGMVSAESPAEQDSALAVRLLSAAGTAASAHGGVVGVIPAGDGAAGDGVGDSDSVGDGVPPGVGDGLRFGLGLPTTTTPGDHGGTAIRAMDTATPTNVEVGAPDALVRGARRTRRLPLHLRSRRYVITSSMLSINRVDPTKAAAATNAPAEMSETGSSVSGLTISK